MEYNNNFADNINARHFNQRAEEIANWIQENRLRYDWARDPNAYEMTNIFLFAGKYISEGQDINLEPVKKIWDLRKGDFERCGIEENQFVYQICKQAYDASISGRALVNDESSHSALRKMAGIGLYIMQQRRTENIDYNNVDELINLIKNAKVLKQRYPHLHSSLKFENNINVLYRLQKVHLDEKTSLDLDEVYNNYLSEQVDHNKKYDNEQR